MRVPLTAKALEQAQTFDLRSSCVDCFHYVAREERCASEWPVHEQRRWPLDAPDELGEKPTTIALCKEFELA